MSFVLSAEQQDCILALAAQINAARSSSKAASTSKPAAKSAVVPAWRKELDEAVSALDLDVQLTGNKDACEETMAATLRTEIEENGGTPSEKGGWKQLRNQLVTLRTKASAAAKGGAKAPAAKAPAAKAAPAKGKAPAPPPSPEEAEEETAADDDAATDDDDAVADDDDAVADDDAAPDDDAALSPDGVEEDEEAVEEDEDATLPPDGEAEDLVEDGLVVAIDDRLYIVDDKDENKAYYAEGEEGKEVHIMDPLTNEPILAGHYNDTTQTIEVLPGAVAYEDLQYVARGEKVPKKAAVKAAAAAKAAPAAAKPAAPAKAAPAAVKPAAAKAAPAAATPKTPTKTAAPAAAPKTPTKR